MPKKRLTITEPETVTASSALTLFMVWKPCLQRRKTTKRRAATGRRKRP